jgi:hypothetical protein
LQLEVGDEDVVDISNLEEEDVVSIELDNDDA